MVQAPFAAPESRELSLTLDRRAPMKDLKVGACAGPGVVVMVCFQRAIASALGLEPSSFRMRRVEAPAEIKDLEQSLA